MGIQKKPAQMKVKGVADIVFCFCHDYKVSSTILDLIIVLFRGNGKKSTPCQRHR